MRTIIAITGALVAVTIRPEITDFLAEFSAYIKIIVLIFLLMDIVELVSKMRHA